MRRPADTTDISGYDYDLPPGQIAQAPLSDRGASRLLVVDRSSDRFHEERFSDIVELLAPGDVLVRNDTRVVPARLRGVRLPDGAPFEALFFDERPRGTWRALVRPAKKLRRGTPVRLGGELEALVEGPEPGRGSLPGERHFALDARADLRELMLRVGAMPLPPYIRGFDGDPERYQTTYARQEGAVAAPTAGFHFTPELFTSLREKGIRIVDVTLHVGPGTFQPVRDDDYTLHRMHPERFSIGEESSRAVEAARREGRRVVAVGSTSLRVLETAAARSSLVTALSGETDLYVYPGYRFRVVDALVTNFHLPRTTLLLMVAAFGGVDLIRRAYAHAVSAGFRFYSFGDAMLIL
jgi:S-adenosylmethionine:tRNA ribosyltransferase-isomerase